MKKIFYDSTLAGVLLFFSSCHTVTVGPFVCSKLKEGEVRQYVRNHECTHSRQWMEITVVAGLVIWSAVLAFDVSAWWLSLSGLAFYLLYGMEWVARLIALRNTGLAYLAVSFESEAREAEYDENYLENCNYFTGWFKYLRRGWRSDGL